MNIFCLYIMNDSEKSSQGGGNSSAIGTSTAMQFYTNMVAKQKQVTNGENKEQQLDVEARGQQEIRGEDSQSATGSSSTHNSSTTSMAEFRNFHSFSEQTTPKSLMTITYLVATLYLVMTLIASVNLGINLARQKQSESDVLDVRLNFDRMNWVSMNQLLVRVLINTANGYELENSNLVEDRFAEYMHLQKIRVQQLKDTQSQIQKSSFLKSAELVRFLDGNNINIYYLNEQNQVYQTKENLKIAMNLYIAKLNEMNSLKKADFKGNLRIQNIRPRDDSGYRPNVREQLMFFVVENGNREMRQFAIEATKFYSDESVLHAEQNITSTKVTAIISVVVIVIIGLIIAPILTQAEIRKYKALLYFLKIPKEKFAEMIKNCEYCINMNEENRYYQIQKDYEKFLGVKLVGQQVEQLRQAREEQTNIDNQLSRDVSTNNYGTLSQSQAYTSNDNPSTASRNMNATMGPGLDYMGSVNSATDFRQQKSSALSNGGGQSRSLKTANKPLQSQIEQIVREEELEDESNDNEVDQGENVPQINNRNKFNIATLNLKKGTRVNAQGRQIEDETSSSSSNANVVDSKQSKIDPQELERQKLREEERKQQEEQEIESKIRLINNQAYRRRSTVVFTSLSVILLLSTYFIIAYFLAMRTFQTAADVINNLEIIFYKGSCFDSAMNFMRENLIRNQSMYINANDTESASDYYIQFCFKKEVDYNKMRTNMPVYFKGIQSTFDNLESSQLCDFTYGAQSVNKNDILLKTCKTALNGLLNKGLTNAFYYMYTQILKQNLHFNSLEVTRDRTEAQLEAMILDEEIIEIIDMKAKVLDLPLNDLKEQCMKSVISYIQLLLQNFIVAFIVFILILTFAVALLIFLGFKILRRNMWDTNIILKIIPFETLPRKERIEIKDFFNS